MNTIKDIFTEYPNSWIQCLPKYQQNVINELYSQLGDYNQVATSWLNASMPIPPPPLKRSRKRQSGISGCRILNSVSFIRSVVGRVSMPGTVLRLSRLAVPAITLILNSVSNPDHHGQVRESEVQRLRYW